jgi:hypothetical protein
VSHELLLGSADERVDHFLVPARVDDAYAQTAAVQARVQLQALLLDLGHPPGHSSQGCAALIEPT